MYFELLFLFDFHAAIQRHTAKHIVENFYLIRCSHS